jgi:predicted RNA-binding protein with TRAM domain
MSYGNRGYGRGGGGYGRGGSFDRSFGGPKPVEVGKEYDVQIAEISRQGDGIARIQGFVIFVKGAKVGEKTKIKVVNVGPRFATAEKVATGSAASQPEEGQKQVAPPVTEAEKPELQGSKSESEQEPPAS